MHKKPGSWIRLALIFLGLMAGLSAAWLSTPLGTLIAAEAAAPGGAAAPMAQQTLVVTFRQGVEGYTGCTDTRISQENPSANFGNQDLYLGIRGRVASLIRFDVSSIPSNVTVQEATLGLYVWNSGPAPTEPLRCAAYSVNRAWQELEATWIRASAVDAWGVEGCNDVPSDRSGMPLDEEPLSERNRWYTWDVTSAVRGWLEDPGSNKGLYLRQSNVEIGGEFYARSSEWEVTDLRPYLIVLYVLPTPTPTSTPTLAATPTMTLTPTPSEHWLYLPVVLKGFPKMCVQWQDVFTEEFEDVLLGGWSKSMEGGQSRVWASVLDLWADPFIDRFPLVWRNDVFEEAGSDFAMEVRFRYSGFTGYGTTIALNSESYEGERVPDGPTVPPGQEDILAIHHVVDPIRSIFRFDAKLLGGVVKWETTPGNTDWHVARLTLDDVDRYTLYIDGHFIGSARSSATPRSIYIGNPFIAESLGTWTQLHVDYVRVSDCVLWRP
jgi:hypothetical protein